MANSRQTGKLIKGKPTLEHLFEDLQQAKVYECALQDDTWIVEGLTDFGNGSIYIDPRPAILDTVIHELIHRHRPWWSEIAVRRHTAHLINQLGEKDMQRWWKMYQKVKKAHRPVKLEED